MPTQPIDDCFLHDKDRLTHAEALDILKTNTAPKTATETIKTNDGLERVLAQTITAPRPIPAHRNSAVDGYAFSHAHYDAQTGTRFKVTHRIKAGDPLLKTIPQDEAVRIFTGAVMPEPLDSIVMQEDVTVQEDPDGTSWVTIPGGLKQNANCRQAGEDTKQDAPLVTQGTKLSPQHLAILASGGIERLEVYQPLKVACLSTGNEIIRSATDFELGKVFDSNGPMLQALAAKQNCTITDLGIIKDDKQTIQSTLQEAAKTHDLIITSGGASKGEEDHVITSLNELGTRHLWQLAIKPGRPMNFGQIGDSIFIGLPGNPVAAFICFLLYASPLLRHLGGEPWPEPPRFKVPANFAIGKKKPDRREFMRGRLMIKDGQTWVEKFQQDGSGLIQSLTTSDGLIEIDEETTKLEQGSLVNFLPFSYWGL